MQVSMKKYAKLSSATFHGFVGGKRIAVIRASGAISGAEGGGVTSSGIHAEKVSRSDDIMQTHMRVETPKHTVRLGFRVG